MNPNTTQQVITALTPLAHKIGQGGETVWRAEYKQVYIDAVTTILFWGGLLVITLIAWRLIVNRQNREYTAEIKRGEGNGGYHHAEDYLHAKWAVHVAGIILSFLFASVVVAGGIQPLINPVFQATVNILGQVNPAANK